MFVMCNYTCVNYLFSFLRKFTSETKVFGILNLCNADCEDVKLNLVKPKATIEMYVLL